METLEMIYLYVVLMNYAKSFWALHFTFNIVILLVFDSLVKIEQLYLRMFNTFILLVFDSLVKIEQLHLRMFNTATPCEWKGFWWVEI